MNLAGGGALLRKGGNIQETGPGSKKNLDRKESEIYQLKGERGSGGEVKTAA